MPGDESVNNLFSPLLFHEELADRLAPLGWVVTVSSLSHRRRYWVIGRRNVPRSFFRRFWDSIRLHEDKFWVYIDGQEEIQQFTYRLDIGDDTKQMIESYLLPSSDDRRLPDNILTMVKVRR